MSFRLLALIGVAIFASGFMQPIHWRPFSDDMPGKFVFSESVDPRVENGTYTENTTLVSAGITEVWLPTGTEIIAVRPGEPIVVQAAKTMGNFGHPPGFVSIRETKDNMGFAYRISDRTMTISTWGEISHSELGFQVKLKVLLPENIKVHFSDDLRDRGSLANRDRLDNNLGSWRFVPKPPAEIKSAPEKTP